MERRAIPLFWRVIDMLFGVFGIAPLWVAWKMIGNSQYGFAGLPNPASGIGFVNPSSKSAFCFQNENCWKMIRKLEIEPN